MRKSNLIFSAILLPLDYLMLILAALTAYGLRYVDWVKEIRPVVFNLEWQQYFNYVWPITFGWLVIFALAGLYKTNGPKRIFQEMGNIFLACSTSMLAVIVGAFFSRELFNSRFILLFAWILAIIFVILERLIVQGIQRVLYSRDWGINRVILIGKDKSSEDIAKEIYRHKTLGYKIIDRFDNYVDNKEKIFDIYRQKGFEEVWQTDSSLSRHENLSLLDFANEHHLIFKYVADFFATQSLKFDIYTLAGVPLVEVKKTDLDGWGRILKRIFDIIFSLFFLIIFLPLFLILAILIKLDSPGPIFHLAKRIGAYGREIGVWKFRSMIKDAAKMKAKLMAQNEREGGPLFKMNDDPRITKFGRFIRKWSLDELPQFWNVFKGEMSLVGPRPHEPEEVDNYKKHHKKLLNIKPGITGMAQVSGRSDLEFEEEVRLDTFYIENWSMWLDMIILIKTPWVVFNRKGAK